MSWRRAALVAVALVLAVIARAAVVSAGAGPTVKHPAVGSAVAHVDGLVLSVRPYLLGGPTTPPQQIGCVINLAAGESTMDVLVADEFAGALTYCASVQPGQMVAFGARLVGYWCELDSCVQRLSIIAQRRTVRPR